MVYSIVVKAIGSSFGFSLTEEMVKDLKLKVGDDVNVEIKQILREGVPVDTQIFLPTQQVIKSGGPLGGVTIGKKYLDAGKIKKDTILNIEIEKK